MVEGSGWGRKSYSTALLCEYHNAVLVSTCFYKARHRSDAHSPSSRASFTPGTGSERVGEIASTMVVKTIKSRRGFVVNCMFVVVESDQCDRKARLWRGCKDLR